MSVAVALAVLTVLCQAPPADALDSEVGFESSGKTWAQVVKDLHDHTGLPIAAALREQDGCSGYPATRTKLRDLLDCLSAAMGSSWSFQKGCILITPRRAGEALPTDLKSQRQAVGEFVGSLKPEEIEKLTTGHLAPRQISGTSLRLLTRLAQTRSDGAGQVFAQSLDKAAIYLRFTPTVDILDDKGNIASTVRLFSQVDYMVPESHDIDPDSSSDDARLAELLIHPPAKAEPKPGDVNLADGAEGKLSDVMKKVSASAKVVFTYDRRLRDSRFLLIGNFPADAFEEILRAVTATLPTERAPEREDWDILASLEEGVLRDYAEADRPLDFLDVTVRDFLAQKEMSVGDLGPLAFGNSQSLQALGAKAETRIRLRPGVTLIVDPHERRIVPEPAAVNGRSIPMYKSFFMSWTVSD